jgi:hypothetical protein
LIFKGESPYHNDISDVLLDIDRGYRQIDISKIPNYFLPLYSSFLYVPFAAINNYELANGLFMTLLEVSVILIAIYAIDLVDWNVHLLLIPVLLLFSIFWFFGLQGIEGGNIAIIASLFLILCLKAIKEDREITGAFFLASATIRPILSILFIICILIWSATNQKFRFIRWFLAWMFILFLSGVIFLPDWVLQNIQAFVVYTPDISLGSLGIILETWLPGIGSQLNLSATILLCVTLLLEWWFVRGKEFRYLLWTITLTLTIGQLIGLISLPGDAVLLFLPLVLILAVINDRWEKTGKWFVFIFITLAFTGPWLFARYLLLSENLLIHPYLLNFPFTFFIFIILLWVRWWAIRPARISS